MVQVLVIGLVEGTLFGLLAVGITLIHRGTGSINFALGEVGTFGLYVAWWLSVDQGLPWIIGAIGAVVGSVGLSLGFERFVVRPMKVRNPLAISVATVGLLTALLSFEFQQFGESPREVPVPIHGLGIRIAGVNVSPTQLLSVAVVAAIALGLAQFLRRTDFGLGVLAAAQDPDATRLVGVPLRRVTAFVWGAAGAVAALAALFVAPTVGVLTPGFASTHLFVVALIAAVVGGLSSLPGAFVGGLALGILKSGVLRVFSQSTLPGKEYLVYLAIAIAVLLFRPNGILGTPRLRSAS
ncbi:MAG: branched-chain amino acid ABC transporter permease [Microthrixaceae bacterium]